MAEDVYQDIYTFTSLLGEFKTSVERFDALRPKMSVTTTVCIWIHFEINSFSETIELSWFSLTDPKADLCR